MTALSPNSALEEQDMSPSPTTCLAAGALLSRHTMAKSDEAKFIKHEEHEPPQQHPT